MVVLSGSAWLTRLAFREIGPCRRFWLFGLSAGMAWLLHPAAYPFAPRDFSGSGLAPCFDSFSGLGHRSAQLGEKPSRSWRLHPNL